VSHGSGVRCRCTVCASRQRLNSALIRAQVRRIGSVMPRVNGMVCSSGIRQSPRPVVRSRAVALVDVDTPVGLAHIEPDLCVFPQLDVSRSVSRVCGWR
jgi:hypothetical protein